MTPEGSSGDRLPVWGLAVAQTLAWGGLYYSFPALLVHWEASLGWSKGVLTGAFTAALLASAIGAPFAGRLVDRGHGPELLAGSALAGGIALATLAVVETPLQFYLVWIGLGVCMAGALYEPCFAYVTHVTGSGARAAITLITLVAGFAGTVSFPSAHVLTAVLGWRDTAVVFGLVVCLVVAPLTWVSARAMRREPGATPATASGSTRGVAKRVLGLPAFWLLAIAFAMLALNHGMLLTHLLPLLADRAIAPEMAVLAASLVGPMQVAGRVAMVTVGRRLSIVAVCAFAFLAVLMASVSFYLAAFVPLLVFLAVALQGAGNGVSSIAKPVVTAERLGRVDFGAISGLQATVYMGAFALAPAVASWLWAAGGYDLVIVVAGVCMMVSLGCVAGVVRLPAPGAQR